MQPSSNIVVPNGSNTSPYHVQIDFPHRNAGTNFAFNSTTPANWDVDTNFTNEGTIDGLPMTPWTHIGDDSTHTDEADSVTAPVANTTGGTVIFPFGDATGFTLASTTLYCFHIINTMLHNSDAATAPVMVEGSVKVYDNTGTPVLLEETLYNTSIINDDSIVVSAIVPPNFTISKPNTTDSLGRLNVTGITGSTGVNVTITTNAAGGWIAWIKDTARVGVEGLRSTNAAYTIPTGPVGGAGATVGDGNPEVLPTQGGAEGYVVDADITDAANGCDFPDNTATNGSIDGSDADYDADQSVSGTSPNQLTVAGGTLSEVWQPLAECSAPPLPATANGDVINLKEYVTISGATPAGNDYTDTLYIVAAGKF
jgi:hypothetical protein